MNFRNELVWDRRRFLRNSVLASGAAACLPFATAEQVSSMRLKLDPQQTGNTIAPDFTGLSYETAQLSDPAFFSADNTELAGFVRRLGAGGVLRVGGNTSAYCNFDRNASASAAQASGPVGPDPGHAPAAHRVITPLAIRNLRGFLDATGWRLIYGLNLGSGTPESAADEAAFVMETMGPKLIAFQLCNEPDLFAGNGLRKPGYGFPQFADEWQRFYQAIKARNPQAKFAGPDTAYNDEWLVPFARRFKNDIVALSQHYYAEGPPTDPSMTIDRLLRPNPKLVAELDGMRRTVRESGLPFRLAETNSCYAAGKQGVSDTFASALWGADLMYQLASAGGTGINFHGGGFGWYTPIAGTRLQGFTARPIYYGMLLFAEAGPGKLISATLSGGDEPALVTAYALRSDAGPVKLVVFNKDGQRGLRLDIDAGGVAGAPSIMRLSAPRLDDTTDTTLGADPVGGSGAWTPALTTHGDAHALEMPPGSAALITFGAS